MRAPAVGVFSLGVFCTAAPVSLVRGVLSSGGCCIALPVSIFVKL